MAENTNKKGSIMTHGPYGSQNGKKWSMVLEDGEIISEVTVKTGSVVDSIAFTTVMPTNCGCGWSATHRKFGGNGGYDNYKIKLKCGEYITQISGETGKWENQQLVIKLKIHTNFCPDGYGPYGNGKSAGDFVPFSTPVSPNARIVGFLGSTHNNYIQSIGLFYSEMLMVEQNGPYGSTLPQNWDMKLEPNASIREVIIKHAKVVYAIGFVVAKPCAQVTTCMFGGTGGNESKINLKHGEYITHISGIYGDYASEIVMPRVVGLLKIHTNLCPAGYGPYGKAIDVQNMCNFISPFPSSDGRVIGFYGRRGTFLESIGTHIQKASPSSQ